MILGWKRPGKVGSCWLDERHSHLWVLFSCAKNYMIDRSILDNDAIGANLNRHGDPHISTVFFNLQLNWTVLVAYNFEKSLH